MGAHAGLSLNHFLYGVARDGGRLLDVLDAELFGSRGLALLFGNGHLGQLVVVEELYEQGLFPFRAAKHARLGLIAHHREFHHDGILRTERHLEFSLQVGHGYLALREHAHGGQFHGVHLFVGDLTLEREALGTHSQGACQ